MYFYLMSVMSLVPFALGIVVHKLFGKSNLTKALALFMFLTAIWQIDVAMLYTSRILPFWLSLFLFKLFRFGSIILLPALFYIAYVCRKEYAWPAKTLFAKIVCGFLHKRTVLVFFILGILIYAISCTQYGVRSIQLQRLDGYLEFYYPVYGTYHFLYQSYLVLCIVSLTSVLAISFLLNNEYVARFLKIFLLSATVSFLIGMLNMVKSLSLFAGGIAVVIFSFFMFTALLKMHLDMLKEYNAVVERQNNLAYTETLTSGLIHELRQPLTAIIGFTQLLPMLQPLNQEGKDIAENLTIAGRHLKSIVDDFAEFIKSGQMQYGYHNIIQTAKEAINLIATKASTDGIHVKLETDVDTIICNMDADKMRQVFLNILKNGMEAIPADAVVKECKVHFIENKETVCVNLFDTGTGIPLEMRSTLFHPFNTTKEQGMGLGLSICHNIVLSHKGEIEVITTDEKGTHIRILIPKNAE